MCGTLTSRRKGSTSGSGSALIIAMLLVSGVTLASFGLARIFLADIRTTSAIEDSITAYYVAEAGVEEGLLRYKAGRTDAALNDVTQTRSLGDGTYTVTSTFLTAEPHVVDTRTECPTDLAVCDFPGGRVGAEQTVEIPMPATGVPNLTVRWVWNRLPTKPQCGVEITSVFGASGNFEKVLDQTIASGVIEEPLAANSGISALRIKPICEDLDWLVVDGEGRIGRTVQSVTVTSTAGGTKRRLEALINRRAGSLVGLFDFVLESGGEIVSPPAIPPPPPPAPPPPLSGSVSGAVRFYAQEESRDWDIWRAAVRDRLVRHASLVFIDEPLADARRIANEISALAAARGRSLLILR